MSEKTTAPWPPPPDLDSIKELVRDADVEGFIADGAPADEYDTEAEDLFRAIQHFATKELVAVRLMPILKRIWAVSFNVSGDELVSRTTALEGLANQISRFFGPEAVPQVRGS
jgi:hypothetical protein